MRHCNVCIHTDDKRYTQTPDMPESAFSSINIGTHKTVSHPEALNTLIWDSSEVVYWQLDSQYAHLTEKEHIDLIRLAFLETSLLTPLKIRQKRRQTGDAHIKINWIGAKDEKFFKDRPSVLAFAYGPESGIGGDITMNTDHIWYLGKNKLTMQEAFESGYIDESKFDREHPNNILRSFDPLHTMKHEGGGHSCGMKHLENVNLKSTAIMYPFYNGQRVFSDADKDYLFRLYGKSNVWTRITNYIRHKMNQF